MVANNATTEKTATFDTFTADGRLKSIYRTGAVARRGRRRPGDRHRPAAVDQGVQGDRPAHEQPDGGDARRSSRPCPPARSAGGRRSAPRSRRGGVQPGELRLAAGRHHRWQPLGTDDNAPYRVFQDVTGLAKGTARRVPRGAKDNGGQPVGHRRPRRSSAIPGAAGRRQQRPGHPADQRLRPGLLNSEMGCPGDWQPDCAPGPAGARPDGRDLEGHVLPAGGQLRLQGGDQQVLGRELRCERGEERREHPADDNRRAGHVLLRPRDPLDHL